jgi:hypothetical protein
MDIITGAILEFVAALVLGLAGLAIRRLDDWLKLRADGEVRAYLTAALDRAVEYARAEAARQPRTTPAAGASTSTAIVAEIARDYVRARVPDALARLGVDTAGLDQLIRARLPKPPIVGG